MRCALAFLLVMVSHQAAFAQAIALSGRVSDNTGGALHGVTVQVRGPNSVLAAETSTDAEGRYQIVVGQPGRYELRYSLISFGNVTKHVMLRAGDVDVLNLFDSRASDVDYFYRSRLEGEPPEGVEDIHTHPVQPRTARVALRVDF